MPKMTAREAWHYALHSPISGSAFLGAKSAGGGPRSSTDRISQCVLRGFLLREIEQIKIKHPASWCWGMVAYAPIDHSITPCAYAYLHSWAAQKMQSAISNSALESITPQQWLELTQTALGEAINFDLRNDIKPESWARMAKKMNFPDGKFRRLVQPIYLAMRDAYLDLATAAVAPLASVLNRAYDFDE